MCLAIPGRIVAMVDEQNRLAKVDVAGVQRTVNIGLLDEGGGGAAPGDWVLIHVGFALSKVDEAEARATLRLLEKMGQRVRDGAGRAQGERDRMIGRDSTACGADGHCITCSDEGAPMRVAEPAVSGWPCAPTTPAVWPRSRCR